jgi:hypothetical protein
MWQCAHGDTYSCHHVDGQRQGYMLIRYANGRIGYFEYAGGTELHRAITDCDGRLTFDSRPCDADHAGFQRLKAGALPVEVRRRVPAAHTAQTAPTAWHKIRFFCTCSNVRRWS